MKALLTFGLFALPALALIPTGAIAQFGLPVEVPKAPEATQIKPRGLPVPTATDLVNPSPPITTSLAKAYPEVVLFDDWQPQDMQPLTDLSQDAEGNFQLKPGLYTLEVESYSLQVGSYGPGKRSGYLPASLVENNRALIGRMLQQAAKWPDIPQAQIQTLIWAILSRAEMKGLSKELQATAKQLLTPEEIKTLNQQALGLIPADQKEAIFTNVPAAALTTVKAEASMRVALDQKKSYGDLAKIAVQSGNPKTDAKDRTVPQGRWSYHPNGFFIRYLPAGYSRTEIQIAVPEKYQVQRDTMGRIVAIADTAGNRIETDYDDTVTPLAIPDDPNLVGYAFSEIRFIRTTSKTAPPEKVTLANMGWTLMQKASSQSLSLPTQPRQMASQPFLIAQASPSKATDLEDSTDLKKTTPSFEGWKKRYKQTEDYQDVIAEYLKRWQTAKPKVQQLADLFHYADAIAAATDDKEWKQYKWLKEHQAAILKALQSETALLEASGQSPTLTFNPAQTTAVAAQKERQILGLSNRPYKP
ncbi:hypothetical protein [Acaryochloris marina]|uniref:Uncharacterized protein n=1 Tax=Acaryochloris marina (strain MBIC 11017) TaxID=329726 RepID=B0CEP7_ACAM1|nr:hypothetical protein [Acaryochloris marina]ABW28152.1 hypothetical protein AM1_3156 [Acaryochloris marina MBIC11017]BDM77190.1 hypothetical protein AM10699_00640 [Acaryochloris marina MBIC10699]